MTTIPEKAVDPLRLVQAGISQFDARARDKHAARERQQELTTEQQSLRNSTAVLLSQAVRTVVDAYDRAIVEDARQHPDREHEPGVQELPQLLADPAIPSLTLLGRGSIECVVTPSELHIYRRGQFGKRAGQRSLPLAELTEAAIVEAVASELSKVLGGDE